jgi:hypothetical protein
MRSACFLVGLFCLLAGPALADPVRDEVLSGAARCDNIPDNRAWLDCFYGSAQPMRSLLGLQPAPQAQLKLVPPVNVAPPRKAVAARPAPRSGGFLADLLGSTKPVVSDMPMQSYRFAPDRTFTVTLKNGDIYQQEESDLVFASWKGAAANYRVTITASADKYIMRVKGEPGANFHVRRK